MRRFSQRNSLVTLNDINITPLLDLAFVLLIIFIITTPLLEKGLDLQLPSANGAPDKTLTRRDIRTVEITPQGNYYLEHKTMKLDQLLQELGRDFKANTNLLVYIRGDENGRFKQVAEVLGRCEELGITRISIRTDSRSH